jgi:glyoxylase-like metal-dependent hydrolase (beta-lactamase superfamily II)
VIHPGDRRSKRTILVLVAATVALLAGVVWLRPRGFSPRAAPLAEALEPDAVALGPGVYLLGKSQPAAVYLVETSEGLLLVDSGLEANASLVLEQISRLGFDAGRIKAILLTHVHADHSLGANRLRALSGAKVYAGRADSVPLQAGEPREMFFSTFHMPHVPTHPTEVDVALTGGETLTFGETHVEVLATPGHTTGSVCYRLRRPDVTALFAGDVIQNLSRPEDGLMGTYAAALPPLYGGDARAYLDSLRRLRSLPPPDLLLPGHPRMDPVPQNPRLSEAQWQALLEVGTRELETLLARYEADGADFLDGKPRELLPGLHYFGNVGAAAVYCLDAPEGKFLFDAPGDAALGELVRERFAKLNWKPRDLKAVLLTSADKEATQGLAVLVRATGCEVAAPRAGLDVVRERCPPGTVVRPVEDLGGDGPALSVLPLEGRGRAPVAYHFAWHGAKVLLSGRIPVKPAAPALESLRLEVGGAAAAYLRSLDKLAKVRPNLWLPAVPIHGQNANVYDDQWLKTLGANQNVFRR